MAASEAVDTVGLLSWLEAAALEELLPLRLREWNRAAHDRFVRLLACGGAPERGRVLIQLLDLLDPQVRPLAVDEIGICGDPATAPQLLLLAEGEVPESTSPYLRLKAIEALGRLRELGAKPVLRPLVESKHIWRWVYPRELRIVAAQALEKIDHDWAQGFLPQSGLSPAELSVALLDVPADWSWVRPRRYARVQLPRTLAAVLNTPRGNSRLGIKVLSLSGGVASAERHLSPGALAMLKIQSGFRPVRAQVLVREASVGEAGFEIVEMELEDRARLRRLLGGFVSPSGPVGSGLTTLITKYTGHKQAFAN